MIYKIRIILDAREDIFRDIEMDSGDTLEDFHNIILQAFGFMGNEMASFYTCDERWNQEEEIALFSMNESGNSLRLMQEISLEEALSEARPKLIYVYDYLSMWTFFVELADVAEKDSTRSYPNILFSFGELPDDPPERNFESEPGPELDDSLDNYEDMDFDENWN